MATKQSAPSPSSQTKLPDFHLLCLQDSAASAFQTAITAYFPSLPSHTTISYHDCSLKFLSPSLRFGAVVSPANSYARLDGAFDDALARVYGPQGDYAWITRKAQAVLYRDHRGFAPPGSCTIVRLDHDLPGDARKRNPWRTEYLLLCPTMRTPQDVRWDREVVYECIWSLLCAVDGHNRKVRGGKENADTEIKSILMTPLATGCGRISLERWAEQCVLAMKHWVEAVEHPEIWAQASWKDVLEGRDGEIRATWEQKGTEESSRQWS